jgi:hypothetical protein
MYFPKSCTILLYTFLFLSFNMRYPITVQSIMERCRAAHTNTTTQPDAHRVPHVRVYNNVIQHVSFLCNTGCVTLRNALHV